MRKKTNIEFLEQVKNVVGEEYTFLEQYVNNSTKINVRHNVCGNIYSVSPDKFLFGRRCPYCAKNKKKTHEEFVQEVYKLVGYEYTVLSEYTNNKTKIKMKHNCDKCSNYTYLVTPNDFLNGYRCPKFLRLKNNF